MNIVVPYTILPDAFRINMIAQGISPKYYHMDNDESYWETLNNAWKSGETFIVLESDVLPWPGSLEELDKCGESYCGFPYRIRDQYRACLGCTKFSGSLTKEAPDLIENIANRYWGSLDNEIEDALFNVLGLPFPHTHLPPVVHVSPRHASFYAISESMPEEDIRFLKEHPAYYE